MPQKPFIKRDLPLTTQKIKNELYYSEIDRINETYFKEYLVDTSNKRESMKKTLIDLAIIIPTSIIGGFIGGSIVILLAHV